MPTIKNKLYFNYGGIWSHVFNLIQITTNTGMFEENFVASRDIVETKTKGSDEPLFHGIESSPKEFEMEIAFESAFDEDNIYQIIMWLFSDTYKPLFFEGSEDRVFYCIAVGEPSIIHNGLNQGYFKITMRCNSSNIFSQNIITPNETVNDSKIITIENVGHFTIFPEISIKKIGTGTITIESLDDFGSIFEVRDLTNQEDIYLDCKKEIIKTDIIGVYRYDKVIGEYPRILCGSNRFKVTGECEIQFRYKNKYRF
ncbi:phage tail family protein [Halobacillus rhizosphaerae]|uniref:hypothetical protein n=1 Tax=Halobacillus rhizosphaerae TaxID=3064889 RepID=UPI00398B16CF